MYTVCQNGTVGEDWTVDLSVADDGSMVIGVAARNTNNTFSAVKHDADGAYVWQWQVCRDLRRYVCRAWH